MADEPMSLVDAMEAGRPELLRAARRKLAEVIDGGVAAHALARLLQELDRLDTEIRRLDEIEEDEDDEEGMDEEWDPSLI